MHFRPQAPFLTVLALAITGCGSGLTTPPQTDTGDVAAQGDTPVEGDVGVDTSDDVGVDSRDALPRDVGDDDLGDSDAGTAPDVVEPEPPLEWADAAECAVESCDLGVCDPVWGTCRCPTGTFFNGFSCALLQRGVPDECIVTTAALSPIAANETLVLRSAGPFEVAIVTDLSESQPENWAAQAEVDLARFEGTRVRVFAQPRDERCADYRFSRVFDVRGTYPPAAGEPGSDALSADADSIVGWASVVEDYGVGGGVIQEWRDPARALGPAEGNSFDIVSLGEGGVLTLGFNEPVADGLGADFVLFENGFSDTFLEFAFVEVSSDGETYVRFDSASQTEDPVGQFGGVDPAHIGALGGRYRQGWGTPYDLGALRQHRDVITGDLDLSAIRYVRIVDVIGDGSVLDSFGRPIYDPTPTEESAGFDVDAVGVIHTAGSQ